jgi:hypothetical protein
MSRTSDFWRRVFKVIRNHPPLCRASSEVASPHSTIPAAKSQKYVPSWGSYRHKTQPCCRNTTCAYTRATCCVGTSVLLWLRCTARLGAQGHLDYCTKRCSFSENNMYRAEETNLLLLCMILDMTETILLICDLYNDAVNSSKCIVPTVSKDKEE